MYPGGPVRQAKPESTISLQLGTKNLATADLVGFAGLTKRLRGKTRMLSINLYNVNKPIFP
jgi:hypothetical protein